MKRKPEKLIQLYKGHQNLRSFLVTQLVYDVTVHFCRRYIEKRSHTLAALLQRGLRVSIAAKRAEAKG